MNVSLEVTPVFHWNYEAAQDARFRYIINQGGSSSSKTYSTLQVLCFVAMRRPGTVITVTAETLPALRKGAIRDFDRIILGQPFRGWLEKHNKSSHTYGFTNGSVIEFVAFPTEDAATHGKRDFLFINEANHVPYGIAKQLMMRTGGQVFIDFNPTSDFWAHEHYLADPSACWLYSTYRNNPFAARAMVAEIEAYRNTSPEHYKVYGLGRRGALAGQVFPGVQWVPEFPNWIADYVYCMDFGFSNSYTTLAKLAYADGKMWGQELMYERGLLEPEIISIMDGLRVEHSVPVIYDSAAPMAGEYLRRHGDFNMMPCKKRDVRQEVTAMKRYPWNITDDSVNWKKEARNYIYRKTKDGGLDETPIKDFDHLWDAARYGFLHIIAPNELPEFV